MKIKHFNKIEKYLVPDGTKVIYDDELGVVDGNDLETMDDEDEFEDINYYIIPSENINDETPSNHYVMLQREDFEIIDKESLLKRETMWVCEHCLLAIQSHEGNQVTIAHDIDLEFNERNEENSKCDWCEDTDFDVLYELI